MKRFAILVYGLVCYLMFLAVFAYAMGFMANAYVPKSIDSGEPPLIGVAVLVNLSLLALFGVQHSVMARPTFKKWWTQFVPASIERSHVHRVAYDPSDLLTIGGPAGGVRRTG